MSGATEAGAARAGPARLAPLQPSLQGGGDCGGAGAHRRRLGVGSRVDRSASSRPHKPRSPSSRRRRRATDLPGARAGIADILRGPAIQSGCGASCTPPCAGPQSECTALPCVDGDAKNTSAMTWTTMRADNRNRRQEPTATSPSTFKIVACTNRTSSSLVNPFFSLDGVLTILDQSRFAESVTMERS